MMSIALRKKVDDASTRAEVFFPRAKNDAGDTSVDYRACAHWARLKRHIKSAVVKPPVVFCAAGFVNCRKLGMTEGRACALARVLTFADNFTVFRNYDAPYGNFTGS